MLSGQLCSWEWIFGLASASSTFHRFLSSFSVRCSRGRAPPVQICELCRDTACAVWGPIRHSWTAAAPAEGYSVDPRGYMKETGDSHLASYRSSLARAWKTENWWSGISLTASYDQKQAKAKAWTLKSFHLFLWICHLENAAGLLRWWNRAGSQTWEDRWHTSTQDWPRGPRWSFSALCGGQIGTDLLQKFWGETRKNPKTDTNMPLFQHKTKWLGKDKQQS